MFDQELIGKVRGVNAAVKEAQQKIVRIDDALLVFPFSTAFAASIAGGAAVLASMLDGPVVKSTIEMQVQVDATFNAGEPDEMRLSGEVTRIDIARPSEAGPTAKVHFAYRTQDQPHLWFLHHLEEEVAVDFKRCQMELEL